MSTALLSGLPLVGDQAPRLLLQPPEVSNAASEAIAFYARFGRKLDPWQRMALRIGLGELGDGSWASFEVGIIVSRQNGKGYIAECLELSALFLWGCKVIIHSAHRGDTVLKALQSMKQLIKDNPELARRCKPINDSDEQIELLTGAVLAFKTRTGSGGRGLTGDLVVIDEALMLTDAQKASLVPTLLAIPNAMLWYTSTVPSHDGQHLCTVRDRVLNGEPRLAWAEWTAEENARLDDPIQLAKANPALPHRITLNRLADLRGILGDALFKTECMGIWPGTGAGAALDKLKWRDMRDEASRRSGDVVLSADIPPSRETTVIGMFGLRDDGLEHVQILDYDSGVDWFPARLAEHKAVLNPICIVIDAKSGVHAMLPELAAVGIKPPEDPDHPQRGDLLIIDSTQKAGDCTAQFIDAFRRNVLKHIGQLVLDAAVGNVKTRPLGEGQIAWGRKVSSVDIGGVIVISQARYGWYAWHDVISNEYDVLSSIPLADGQCPSCEAWSANGPIIHYEDCQLVRTEVAA